MKNIKIKLIGLVTVTAMALAFPAQGQQLINNGYLNVDWQFNWPFNNGFSSKGSGWGMNFEGGYYFPCNFGLGAFVSYHTNNEYISRRTIAVGETSAVTTDQQHSLFQVPFGAAMRYRFLEGGTFEPYAAVKLGANYARLSSDFYVLEAYDKTWGFYVSPEIGVNIFPSMQTRIGFHIAAYYSYATNSGSVLQYKIDGLNNAGIRVGITF